MARRRDLVRVVWDRRRARDGMNYAILRWRNPETGRRETMATLGYVTPEQAEAARLDHEAAQRLGVRLPSSEAESVESAVELYVLDLASRPVTDGYRTAEIARCVNLVHHMGRIELERVTKNTLARYVGDRRREGAKRSTVATEVATFRRAFRWAVEERLVPADTLVPGPPPLGKDDGRPKRRLKEEEVRRLVTAAHARNHYPGFGHYLTVAAWSGRRPVALRELHVEDLERLTVGNRSEQLVYWRADKGGVARGWGPVAEPVRRSLLAQAELVGSGRLFRQNAGHVLRNTHAHYGLKLAAEDSGVRNVQPYDLRRFACTQVIRAAKGQLEVARRYTGHRNVQTLLRYSYAHEGEAEGLAESIGWSQPDLRAVE